MVNNRRISALPDHRCSSPQAWSIGSSICSRASLQKLRRQESLPLKIARPQRSLLTARRRHPKQQSKLLLPMNIVINPLRPQAFHDEPSDYMPWVIVHVRNHDIDWDPRMIAKHLRFGRHYRSRSAANPNQAIADCEFPKAKLINLQPKRLADQQSGDDAVQPTRVR
jgi:hypothetical protein